MSALLARLRGRSLAAWMADGRDNMVVVRLVAALAVLFGHSYALAGLGMAEADPVRRLLGQTYSHFIGVMMFFTLSGLLITLAWQRRPNLPYFLRSRALRILPALFVCAVASALLLGAAMTTLPAAAYFGSTQPWRYVAGNASLLDLQWTLPGVFASNPTTDYVNGSLWTLPVESGLYLAVAALGLAGLLTRRAWIASVAIVLAAALWLRVPLLSGEQVSIETALIVFFAFGAWCCVNRAWLPLSTPILLILAAAAWLAFGTPLYQPLLALGIAYGTLWLAYVPRLPQGRWGDLSYGTYLWGFPVQQTLIAVAGLRDPLSIFAACLAPTLILAWLSWRLVEQPALRYKYPPRSAPVAAS
ncbi:MAG TPA: acyltransferase [Dokdonella sp.]|uniref:acyltransferase family protein n=1 Tax=Dokdonella sp. TaxID=2291710 RepID=UPI002C8FAE24|nr:acyltransferase [Dokdonella sp.]HUD42909.1 acyltransferase [Dokdonella sp.]